MPRIPVIYPAILARSAKDFRQKIKLSAKYFPLAQIDVMDGRFVAQKTWPLVKVKKIFKFIPKNLFIEVHLMVQNPLPYMLEWAEVAGRYIIHLEAVADMASIILVAKGLQKEIVLAINPNTKSSRLFPYLKDIDAVLLMTVSPGKSGQQFRPSVLNKIQQLHAKQPKLIVAVDGGINEQTIHLAYQAGASRFAVGSAFWENKNLLKTKQQLFKACYDK